MKKLLLMTLSAVLLSSGFLYAEKMNKGNDGHWEGGNSEEHIQQRLNHLNKKLDLTPDQSAKMEKLIRAQMKEMEEENKKLQQKRKAAKEKFKAEAKTILSKEQYEKFEKNMKKANHNKKKNKKMMKRETK